MTQQRPSIARSREQSLIVCTTPAGSSSERALTLLDQATRTRAPFLDAAAAPLMGDRRW
ncbi:hypothetical protein [Streptomyces sp. NPDC048361]|uniref:hypothetical protein n=1 Tax=Streptomyces sp. NPDC048361 TaxID=3154720 RepID=UPI00344968B6